MTWYNPISWFKKDYSNISLHCDHCGKLIPEDTPEVFYDETFGGAVFYGKECAERSAMDSMPYDPAGAIKRGGMPAIPTKKAKKLFSKGKLNQASRIGQSTSQELATGL